LLNEARGTWRSYEIPLYAGSATQNGWRRTPHGSPELSNIQYLEVHADTWGHGFTLWLDGVSFDLPDYCYCDLNFDTRVDSKDLYIFVQHWLNSVCTLASCKGADVNQTGKVDFADFAEFAKHWLEGTRL